MFTAFCKFANGQIQSWDIDPMYPLLKHAYGLKNLNTEQAIWHTLLYLAWYHIGSAEVAWKRWPEPCHVMGPPLPTGIERRGFRANQKAYDNINATLEYARARFGSLTKWVGAVVGAGGEKGWVSVRRDLEQLPWMGTWASYKWADLVKHTLSFNITANDIGVGGGSPTAGPIPGMVHLTGETWKRCATDVALQKELFQESLSAGAQFKGLDQMETSLCDFNSVIKGRYYMGHDIDMNQEQLQHSAFLKQCRAAVFPKKYLGEFNNWTGVRKHLKDHFKKTGEILL